jgi:excisionase family DNA binding protein
MSTLESLTIQPNVYYTVEEAAQLLRISRKATQQLLQSGKLQGIKIGRHWRILGAALLEMYDRGKETEASLVADWYAASRRSLEEVWDNEEDAAYDKL